MNYRHAFHAGNFADVLKHTVLCRVLVHLHSKPGAFRVIDTHAGAGLYDLTGEEARRSGEWRDGIGRLRTATLSAEVAALLAPYLATIAAINPAEPPARYPGSPMLARNLLRNQDRLVANEIVSDAVRLLADALGRDRRCKALQLDAWTALRAQIPPPERRGVVLIDPPFERPDDFAQLRDGLVAARRKWPTGIFIAWYPVKDRTGPDRLAKALQRESRTSILRIELAVGRSVDAARLRHCGLILINPPWTLEGELAVILPVLAEVLSPDGSGSFRVDWLAQPS